MNKKYEWAADFSPSNKSKQITDDLDALGYDCMVHKSNHGEWITVDGKCTTDEFGDVKRELENISFKHGVDVNDIDMFFKSDAESFAEEEEQIAGNYLVK